MDIEGVYEQKKRDEEEQLIEAEKRRRAALPVKVVGSYTAYKPSVRGTVNQYRNQQNLFIFKPKKTREQVLQEFQLAMEAQSSKLEKAFMDAVYAANPADVEMLYLPVTYYRVKRIKKSDGTQVSYDGAPTYISVIAGVREKKHFLQEYMPEIEVVQEPTPKKPSSDDEVGEIAFCETTTTAKKGNVIRRTQGFFSTSAAATKDDLENIEDVLTVNVWESESPLYKQVHAIPQGAVVENCEVLQTLFFPMWVVKLPFGGTFYHYISDVATGVSLYNLPWTKQEVDKTEVRLARYHDSFSPHKTVMVLSFVAVLIFGLVAFIFHVDAMERSGELYPHLTMVLYLIALTFHIANLRAGVQFPFQKEVHFTKLYRTQRKLDECEWRSAFRVYLHNYIWLLGILVFLIVDLCICTSLLAA